MIKCSSTLISIQFQTLSSENTQVKHIIELISNKCKNIDDTFVDKIICLCLNHEDLKNMLLKIILLCLCSLKKIYIKILHQLTSGSVLEKL